jgi:hypothetical protein
MHIGTKFPQPNIVAHVKSPYILSEGKTAMQFYYQIRGGTLNVKKEVRSLGFSVLSNNIIIIWHWFCDYSPEFIYCGGACGKPQVQLMSPISGFPLWNALSG